MGDQNFSNSPFRLWGKWFWIGIVMSLFNVAGGLVYGVVVLMDKDTRKEGAILVVFSLVWFFFVVFVLSPWLMKSGILPQYRLLKVK